MDQLIRRSTDFGSMIPGFSRKLMSALPWWRPDVVLVLMISIELDNKSAKESNSSKETAFEAHFGSYYIQSRDPQFLSFDFSIGWLDPWIDRSVDPWFSCFVLSYYLHTDSDRKLKSAKHHSKKHKNESVKKGTRWSHMTDIPDKNVTRCMSRDAFWYYVPGLILGVIRRSEWKGHKIPIR